MLIRDAKQAISKSPINSIWWMQPSVALGLTCAVFCMAAYVVSPNAYQLYWATTKYVDPEAMRMIWAIIGVFILGALIGQSRRPAERWTGTNIEELPIPWHRVSTLFSLSFFLCVLGYILWAGIGVRNGLTLGIILDGVAGRNNAIYEIYNYYLYPVAGITTLTQFGVATVVLGVPLGMAKGWAGVRNKIAIVFALALIRAVVHSEREALMELMVPGVISYVWLSNSRGLSPFWRRLIRIAPIGAAVGLFVVFGVFEFFRSWLNYYSTQENSFVQFAATRLLGYYATGINNGILLSRGLGHPLGFPYFTIIFAWRFPVLNNLLMAVHPAALPRDDSYAGLLDQMGNPDFNNPSGLFLPVIDFGFVGALLYWLLAGIVCGFLYQRFRACSTAGLFLYPMIFTSLIDMTRILYWADGRAFPSMFLITAALVFAFQGSPAPAKSVVRRSGSPIVNAESH